MDDLFVPQNDHWQSQPSMSFFGFDDPANYEALCRVLADPTQEAIPAPKPTEGSNNNIALSESEPPVSRDPSDKPGVACQICSVSLREIIQLLQQQTKYLEQVQEYHNDMRPIMKLILDKHHSEVEVKTPETPDTPETPYLTGRERRRSVRQRTEESSIEPRSHSRSGWK